MKFLFRCLFVAALLTGAALPVSAQATGAASSSSSPAAVEVSPPDLIVIKSSWSKERLGWERDPFSGPVENFDE
ncbi:MAG TPA: hypothetical protein VF634_04235, partial [Pyrinomonadaceae bacterium]